MAEVVVTGVKETINALNLFVKDIEANQSLNREIGSKVSQNASALAPKRTGALSRSVGFEASPQKATIYAGSSSVPYAGVTEYGWPQRNRQARPFLNPAVQNNMGFIIKKYDEEINKAIQKYNLD
jgi:hypothetical protein